MTRPSSPTTRAIAVLVGALIALSASASSAQAAFHVTKITRGTPSSTASLRAVGDTIGGSFDPAEVVTGQTTTLTVAGVANAPAAVFAKIQPAGGTCGATPDADPGQLIIPDGTTPNTVSGAYSLSAVGSEGAAGQFLVCMWLAPTSSSAPSAVSSTTLLVDDATPAPGFELGHLRYSARTGNLKVRYRVANATEVHWRLSVAGVQIVNRTFGVSDGGRVLTVHFRRSLRRYATYSRAFTVRGSATIGGPGGTIARQVRVRLS